MLRRRDVEAFIQHCKTVYSAAPLHHIYQALMMAARDTKWIQRIFFLEFPASINLLATMAQPVAHWRR